MHPVRLVAVMAWLTVTAAAAIAADDVVDAINQARQAYEAGDLTKAKQSLDLASQLVAQKNAERLAALLPEPLAGWTAAKAESSSVGVPVFGASTASRRYTDGNGTYVDVHITGDSALVTHFAKLLINPTVGGIIGKLIHVGAQQALQTADGSVNIVIADKFLVTVDGSADARAKLAYAEAVEVDRLSKM